MADSSSVKQQSMNPWILHLQKLGLQLKCPLCLGLFNRPMLLPCDHIFCHSCVPGATQLNVDCPVCKTECAPQDLRPMPFIENMTFLFKNMDAAFIADLVPSPSATGASGKSSRESIGQSVFNLTAATTKLLQTPLTNHVDEGVSGCDAKNPNLMQQAAEQLFPCSPPSFGDVKCSDNDSDQTPQNCQSNKQVKMNFDDGRKTEKRDYPDFGTEHCNSKDSKKPKKLNYGPLEMSVKSDDHVISPSIALLPLLPEEHSLANITSCAFCQSSKISEASGPIMHYDNGNPVEGDRADRPDVIHVHTACIEWTPQVYYVGETVKNLKAELARGSKLKCTVCGLKGAALGCYRKSCKRSYHFTCAQQVSKCRWDHENFLLLCPAHTSVKFPNEKSRKCSKNHAKQLEKANQESSLPFASPAETKEIVLCGSALSSEERLLLLKFASMIGGTVYKLWSPNVTHVIASTDANGACTRTLKVLLAISNGKWILNTDWLKACMKNMKLVNEEPYEVTLDNHGCSEGPKNGRIRAVENAPKLFDGLKFFFSGDFVSGYKEDLQGLVIAGGGVLFESKEQLMGPTCGDLAALSGTIVVYNTDPTHGTELGEELTTIWDRLSEAQDLATTIGGQVIGQTWVLESIAGYKLLPFVC